MKAVSHENRFLTRFLSFSFSSCVSGRACGGCGAPWSPWVPPPAPALRGAGAWPRRCWPRQTSARTWPSVGQRSRPAQSTRGRHSVFWRRRFGPSAVVVSCCVGFDHVIFAVFSERFQRRLPPYPPRGLANSTQDFKLDPDGAYSIAFASGHVTDWRWALIFLDQMEALCLHWRDHDGVSRILCISCLEVMQVRQSTLVYNAAVNLCAKSSKWQLATALFEVLASKGASTALACLCAMASPCSPFLSLYAAAISGRELICEPRSPNHCEPSYLDNTGSLNSFS